MVGKKVKISILAYFFVAIVLDGLQRLCGLFILELLQSTSVSRQTAAVPFICSWVVSNMIASISDILINSKMSDFAILFGALLSATGAAVCLFATNITILTASWGLLFGAGHGLAIPQLSKRLENENFTKSSFILQVTPNLGVTIMPFVFNIFNSYYALQGSYLLFCGIILNYLPLALAAAYNIKICIPSIKWRVRKKRKQYFISKDAGITASFENFNDSLEPDLIIMWQDDESQNKTSMYNPEFSNDIVLTPVGRKRSETRGNDLPGLDMNIKSIEWNKNHSQLIAEIKNYENRRNVLEGSFNNTVVVWNGMEHSKPESDSKLRNSFQTFEQNVMNMEKAPDLNSKNKILEKISECETDDVSENKGLGISIKECPGNKTILSHICEVQQNATLENVGKSKNDNILQTHEISENKEDILSKAEEKENLFDNSSKHFQTIIQEKQNVPLSSHFPKNKTEVPLNIKAHVEEFIFETAEEYLAQSYDSKHLEARKNSYRNHLNSLLPSMHKTTDFFSQNLTRKLLKCSKHDKSKVINIYSIPENNKLDEQNTICEEKNNNNKIKQVFNYLKGISLAWLCILLINITFKISLIILLIIFADFGNDIDNVTPDFKWILVAFGGGGIFGKICCCKISRPIPEKYHSIGVVLFLLMGLSTAGILYSPNLHWLASFYCILGALEGGITYLIPKLILEYADKNKDSALSSLKTFLSGITIIFIPYVIGVFRDEFGDYEFLLQILSCSSVMCAFLAYILPYVRTSSNKQRSPSFRNKI